MKTTKATALLLFLLLSGCRPVYVIVTQEAPKASIADSIQLKINQPWSRTSIQNYEKSTEMNRKIKFRGDF